MALQDGTETAQAGYRLFVSPHLDDAVLACGELIASSERPVVVTVFAGRPPTASPLTRWDADCGFAPGDDVVGARRDEDREALRRLDARPVWLDFLDDQYGVRASEDDLVAALAAAIERERATTIFFPLGMFHADHLRTSDAVLRVAQRQASLRWHAYEDPLYRRIEGAVDARAAELGRRGFALRSEPIAVERDAHTRKREALACYRSQLRGLMSRSGYDDALQSEKTWRLLRQPTSAQ